MSDDFKATVRIQRPAKTRADGSDQFICAEAVETIDFELFSTAAVKKILASKDEAAIKAIEDAAECGDEGVLARNTATGLLEMVEDADVQAALDKDFSLAKRAGGTDITYEPAYNSVKSVDDMTLVSTQILRKILGNEEPEEPVIADTEESACDPYNSS